MVKMASKDSGTGNSVESSRSNGSKEGDFMEGGSTTSTIDIIKKKPLLKQASSGMVSFYWIFFLSFFFLYRGLCYCLFDMLVELNIMVVEHKELLFRKKHASIVW
mgnify:CR=1 FL=1